MHVVNYPFDLLPCNGLLQCVVMATFHNRHAHMRSKISVWVYSGMITTGWHAYKYLAKTVHHCFFPIFAILENETVEGGGKVIGQRKFLYIERMNAALLVVAPRVRQQLADR